MSDASKRLSRTAYGGVKGEDYIPYVPTTEVVPEATGYSIIMGIIFAAVFAAANTYLGLKVGLTIAAGIPAAIVTIVGGFMVVYFVTPVRKYMIVEEHGELVYPESMAQAEVLVNATINSNFV